MSDATVSQGDRTPAPGEDHAPAAPTGYEFLDEVGRGGMGVVYRARDLELDREVAVKFLQGQFAPASATAARFVEEARITSQLQHPGIPAVYRVGALPDGRPFLAMKLIKGQTLEALLKAGAPLDPLAVFEAVARAVGYAHAHGVIHRDLKPANVMVGSFGEVQVMDWGLAKVLRERPPEGPGRADAEATTARTEIRTPRDSETPYTQYGSVLGTPAYMAPEQAAGELDKVDCRSDVFGLGGILCVLLTGRPPFAGKDADSVRLAAVRGKTEEAFARLDACGASPEVVGLCKRCLAFEPSERPATANEAAEAVAALRREADERARRAERDRTEAEVRAAEQAKRRRLTLAAAAAVAAVLLLGIGGTLWGLLRATDARDLAERGQKEAVAERDEKERARAAEAAAKDRAVEAQKFAELKRQEAEAAKEVAAQQRRLALDTVRDVLLRVDELMANDVRLVPLRLQIINRMVEDVDKIRDHALKNPLEDRTEAIAYSRIGDIYFKVNRVEDAAVWLRKAFAVLENVAKDAPEDQYALRSLAYAAQECAEAEFRVGNGGRCRELHALSLDLRRKRLALVRKGGTEMDKADAELELANALANVAYADLRMGDGVAAVENYAAADKAFADLPAPLSNFLMTRRTRNEIQFRLGEAKARLGNLDEAEKHYRDALASRKALLETVPGPPRAVAQLRTDLGQSRMGLGDFLLMARKDRAAAAAEYAACLDLFTTGLKEAPDSLDLRQRLAATHYRLGFTAADPGKAQEAYAECLKLRQELAKIDPKDTQAGVELGLALARTGKVAEAEKVVDAMVAQAGKDPQTLFQAACALSVLAGTSAERADADRCRDRAFGVLRDLRKAGWKDRRALEQDLDFDAIREDPRFRELLDTFPKPGEPARPPEP